MEKKQPEIIEEIAKRVFQWMRGESGINEEVWLKLIPKSKSNMLQMAKDVYQIIQSGR